MIELVAHLLPLLLMLVALLAGRYPGADALARPRRTRARPVRRRTLPRPTAARRADLGSRRTAGRGFAGRTCPSAGGLIDRIRNERQEMNRTITAATIAAAALALPGAAQAHVTLQPEEAPAGGFTRMDVRVPNEDDKAGTTKVAVQMPPGFYFVSYEPKAGWSVKVTKRKLDKPVEQFGEKITEEVGQVTLTGDGKTGIVRPGQFEDFGLSVGVPKGKAGSKLTFKATQTYDNGEVVRWIGAPDADKPAPQVTLTPAEDEEGDAAHGDEEKAATEQGAAASADSGDDDGPSTGLVIAALALGALGVAVGTYGLITARRATA